MAQYIVVHTPIDAKVYAGDAFSSFPKECVAKSLCPEFANMLAF
jgi:hypothetical protein